jgi:hypothetical protein
MPSSCVTSSNNHDLCLSLAFNHSGKDFFFSTSSSHAIFLSLNSLTALYPCLIFPMFLSECSYLFSLQSFLSTFFHLRYFKQKRYISLYFKCLPSSALVVNARNQTSLTTIRVWLAFGDLLNCTYENMRYCGVLNRGPHCGCIRSQLTISSRSG